MKNDPERKENPSNFLEALLVEQETEKNFSDKEIYGNVFTMLLAGQDTTSNTIAWAMYYLAQHPEIIKKAREEAHAVYGDNELPNSDQELHQLKYASAIAQEAMRIRPVTPNLYMQANEDVVVNDFAIPKNTTVMLQNKVSQTREQHFSNPNEFIPERWMRGGCPMHENHEPEVFRAFGAGPRFCPGKNLAMHEMTISISMLCKHFDFALTVKPEEVLEQFAFTVFAKNLFVKLTKV